MPEPMLDHEVVRRCRRRVLIAMAAGALGHICMSCPSACIQFIHHFLAHAQATDHNGHGPEGHRNGSGHSAQDAVKNALQDGKEAVLGAGKAAKEKLTGRPLVRGDGDSVRAHTLFSCNSNSKKNPKAPRQLNRCDDGQARQRAVPAAGKAASGAASPAHPERSSDPDVAVCHGSWPPVRTSTQPR